MTFSIKYFLTDKRGSWLDWIDRTGLSTFDIEGKEAVVYGSAGIDAVHVQAWTSADLSQLGAQADKVYLSGNLADYNQTIDQDTGVYTFSRIGGVGGRTEVVKVLVSDEDDVLHFADGQVSLNLNTNSALHDGTAYQTIATVSGPGTPATPPELGQTTSHTTPTKVFITDSAGLLVPMAPQVGQALKIFGSAGADGVYVRAGTKVDATELGAGNDKVYLTGNLADYTQSIDQETGIYTFSRSIHGVVEEVKVTLLDENDELHFADGHVVFNVMRTDGTAPNSDGYLVQIAFTNRDGQTQRQDTQVNISHSKVRELSVDLLRSIEAGQLGWYTGNEIVLCVTLAEAVNIDTTGGQPRLALRLGERTVWADYSAALTGQGGQQVQEIKFSYPVQPGDAAPTGLSVQANALSLNGAQILLSATQQMADLTHSATTLASSSLGVNTDITASRMAQLSGPQLAALSRAQGQEFAAVGALQELSDAQVLALQATLIDLVPPDRWAQMQALSLSGLSASQVTALSAEQAARMDSQQLLALGRKLGCFSPDAIAVLDLAGLLPAQLQAVLSPLQATPNPVTGQSGLTYLSTPQGQSLQPGQLDDLSMPLLAALPTAFVQGWSAQVLGALGLGHTHALTGLQLQALLQQGLLQALAHPLSSLQWHAPDPLGLGLTELDNSAGTDAAERALLHDHLAQRQSLQMSPINSLAQLQALASVVDRLMLTVAGGQPPVALTPDDFALLGITGVSQSRLPDILSALAEQGDAGDSVNTVAKIQALVDPLRPQISGTLALSGHAEEGGILTANTADITHPDGLPLSFSYQWQVADTANGSYTNINGATASSYAIAPDQSEVGKFFRVVVTATNADTASSSSFTSSPSTAVADVNDAATGSAALSGSAQEGGTLTANTSGILDPDGTPLTFSYQWQVADTANGSFSDMANAMGSSFSIAADRSLLGKFLRVVVTATNDGTASGTRFASNPSAAVGDTTPPDAVDLSANPGVQSTADVALSRREWIDSKAIFTGLQAPTATDIAEVRLVLTENWQTQAGVDQLVLNTVRSLNADFSAQNITLGRLTGWNYWYTVSNRTLVLSKHGGQAIQTDQLVEALGAIAFKSSSDSMLARTVDVTYVDPSGNAGANGFVRVFLSEPLVPPGPSVTVTDDMSDVASAAFVLSFSFDRDVFGFDAQDVAISNATKGLFTVLTAREYTLAVTPRANSSGTIQLFLNTTGYADASGYQTTGVVQHTQVFDTRKPVLTVTDPVSTIAAQALTFSFRFSEAVTGFDASDIQVDGGIAGTFTAVSSTLYTLLVAPPAVPGKGSISLSVAADAARDLAGNVLASSLNHVQAFDTTLPEVVSLASNTATLKAGEVATVSVVFSKPVNGLTLSDWAVTNGELSNLRTIDGGLSWTGTLTPSPEIDAGTARLALFGGFADTAGRSVSAVAHDNPHAELSFTLDTTRPRLLSMSMNDSLLHANETATVSMTFSESVTGLSLNDFSAGSAVLSDLASDAQGIRWTMKLTPLTDTQLQGQQLQLTGNPTDAFGNTLQHAAEPAFGVDFWTYAVNSQERDPDYTMTGARVGGYSGASVGWAGNAWAADANDAKQGVLIGSPNWRSGDEAEWAEGAVHGVLGRTATSDLDLSALEPLAGGVWTLGEAEAALGWKTLRVGDVNGDGRQDLALAAPYADAGVGADAGQVWVLLQSGASLADVAAGTGGWAMQGLAEGDALGWSVAAAGDVDGDGFDDVLMAAPYADASADALDAGQVMLVRGRADGTAGASTVWNSPNAGDWLGFAVAGGGDINGDGLADVLLAAPDADVVVGSDTLTDAGQVYVVYGSATGMASLADVRSGTGGRLINGFAEGQSLGHAVAVVGDVNGDGYADMVVGAPDHASARGGAWLVWGGTDDTPLDLGNPGHRAVYLFNGQDDVAQLGYAVAAAGDFNADGFADVALAAPGTDGPAGAQSGAAYVVFGKATARWGASLDVTQLRLGDGSGLIYHGQAAGDGAAGMALAGGGDVNGDGLSDLLVGFAAAAETRGVTQVLLGDAVYHSQVVL